MPSHTVDERRKGSKKGGLTTGSRFQTLAAGKGREGFIAALANAGTGQAKSLTGILGAHQNVATKGGIKRVKRKR